MNNDETDPILDFQRFNRESPLHTCDDDGGTTMTLREGLALGCAACKLEAAEADRLEREETETPKS